MEEITSSYSYEIVASDCRDIDVEESRVVDAFFEQGCGCKLRDGQLYSSGFSKDHFCLICNQCTSLECPALNNILFRHVMATTRIKKLCSIKKSKDYKLKEIERSITFLSIRKEGMVAVYMHNM